MSIGSNRIRAVQAPVIPIVAELIRNHPGTISLGQGVVHYGPPPQAAAQIQRFLEDPENNKYKPVQGLPPLVDALKAKLHRDNQINADDGREIVVTAGGNMAFANAVLAIGDPGDEFVIQSPYYFNHEMAITLAGCRPVLAPTDAAYHLRPGAIAQAINPRTRAVVTISPNNPTGAVYPEAALREVNELCRARGIYHIHDEAYEYFTYGGVRHFSPGSLPDSAAHTISLFSLSKSYGFASWRVGYMAIPRDLLGAIKKIQDTILICAPVISQYAALGALEAGAEYCRQHLVGLGKIREMVMHELDQAGDVCSVPDTPGAFYFLVRVHTQLQPMELVERLVREHKVAVIPGTAFGMDDGCYIRISYAALRSDTVTEGVGRLINGLKTICSGH